MGEFLGQILVAGIAMAIIDGVWLGIVAKRFYTSQIGHLLRKKPHIFVAVCFYVLYIIGVATFVIHPAGLALGYGALFGLVTYGTYDLTNLSTLKGFTIKFALVDMLWGACVTAIISYIAYGIVH
jgi:uncharacterized membrane protein